MNTWDKVMEEQWRSEADGYRSILKREPADLAMD